ncbi:hypothetical protein R1sor_008726 [Riccia sorocarpa]|uniref:Uncharacterized protein n=1 Tax=Riccia sorocarpa TaxID=122646 RepID=A0ABD3HY90_9MARC
MYFKLRKNWSNFDVVLLNKTEVVPIAEGVIFLPFAKSCIENEEVVANGAILGHLYKAFLDSDLPQPQEDIGMNDATRKKRSYNSLKRSKPDPLAATRKKENKRKEKRLTEQSINACLSYMCACKNECMRKVSKKDVCEEREFFYKEPYAKRIEWKKNYKLAMRFLLVRQLQGL